MVTANGFPKSGNHALVKALRLLGEPCAVNHLPYVSNVQGKHILIKRDPRNVVVSALRHMGRVVTQSAVRTEIAEFGLTSPGSLVEQMAAYEGWLSDPNTYVVRYEDLIADDVAMRGIAAYIGVEYVAGTFEKLPGHTETWNIVRSDYSLLWTEETQAAWEAAGGPDLLNRWGYGN